MDYNHSIILHPYGNDPGKGEVGIDPESLHGYWEYRDGTEGGELWFSMHEGKLILEDFDGAFSLPKAVMESLKGYGVYIDQDFV